MSDKKNTILGQEILSLCGKCKLALAHVIQTVNEDGEADRCECKTCGAVHKYKDPDKPKAVKKSKAKFSKKESVSIKTLWDEAMSGVKGTSKTYAMASEFDKGDLISHPTFGQGVVQEIIGHDKIRVIFMSAEKILVQKHQKI